MKTNRPVRRVVVTLTLVMMLVGLSSLAFGDQPTSRPADEVSRITHEVSQEVFSPFCPGKTLAMCPSGNAAEARRQIQSMAEQGKDKEAIKDELIAIYGEEFRVVEAPPEDNAKLFAAVIIGFLVSVTAVALLARRRRDDEEVAEVAPEDVATPEETDGYLEELRSEYQD